MRAEGIIIVLIALLLAASARRLDSRLPGDDYWQRRAKILQDEDSRRIGGELSLNAKERMANQTLMNAKLRELDDSFLAPSTFLPARSFLEVREKIEQSPVFKIIEKMPKGGVLHCHDITITSFDYILRNITYRPNLYVCDDNGRLRFKFFEKPSDDCQWQLLSDARNDDKNGTLAEKMVQQMTMLTDDAAKEYPTFKSAWTQFESVFDTLTPMLIYRPAFEDHYYQGLLELYNDNVFYLELRTVLPTLYDLDGKSYGPLEVARIYKNVTDRFVKEHPDFFGAKIIYTAVRSSNDSQMDEHLKNIRVILEDMPEFVAGFDISNQEDKGRPLIDFVEKLRPVVGEVPFFFHAAETLWNGQESDENLIDAILLGTKRIGHGYGLTKHPEILEMARERDIALELQPISNQVLAFVKDLRNHPANILFADNYPVVVSYDNPGMWGVKGLSYDFYEVFMAIMSRHADLRALKELAINSIEYSSMSEREKDAAMNLWEKKWHEFIDKIDH